MSGISALPLERLRDAIAPAKFPVARLTMAGARREPSPACHPVLRLQRAAGNQAAHRLLSGVLLQTKLTINQPGDVYEEEADRVADQVMRMSDPTAGQNVDGPRHMAGVELQRCACGGSTSGSEPCAECQEEGAHLQRASEGMAPSVAPPIVHQVLGRGGEALDSGTRQFMESRFGRDFGQVRIHRDTEAADSVQAVNALAYTAGPHIAFAAGQYAPATAVGRRLLAHELAHVAQQSYAPTSSMSRALGRSLSSARTDSVHRKFTATGSTADFATMVNRIIAVQNEIRISAAGEVSIATTNVAGPPTRDAQELLATIRRVIGDASTTTIEFIHGATSVRASDRSVIVGNYALGRVDLDDVGAFGFDSSHSRMGDNAAVQLIHEITEQYRKQVHGEAFPVAHAAGFAAQERLLGATLVRESPMTPIAGGTLGEVTTTYRYPDGRVVDVITRMDFATGGIVNVRRVVR